jgi:threonine aldolase
MDIIDLRSDTVTKPTPAMREAMAKAEVGDDVFGEDPTVNKLQEMAAERMGKEAGLYVPSGTMGNLIAVLVSCGRGEEAIMGDRGHTFLFEGGGVSALGGVVIHTLPNETDGSMQLEKIISAIRPADVHHPITKLVILENTHNRCGGVMLPLAYIVQVGELVRTQNLLLHMDGARIFNAAIGSQVEVRKLVEPADSVTFCLSKALCAPVGSVLCGPKAFIQSGKRYRKMLGGGMRQAGVLAAAGIVALEQMIDRLAEDHVRAKKLAESLGSIKGLFLPFGIPQTNMVFISLDDRSKKTSAEIADELRREHIRVGVVGPKAFRLVTHYWIDNSGVDKTIDGFNRSMK